MRAVFAPGCEHGSARVWGVVTKVTGCSECFRQPGRVNASHACTRLPSASPPGSTVTSLPSVTRALRHLSARGRVGAELAYRLDLLRGEGAATVARQFRHGRRDPSVAFDAVRSARYRELWTGAAVTIGAEVEDLGRDFLLISRGDHSTIVRRAFVMLDHPATLELAGDKPLVHRLLAQAGLPITRYRQFEPGDWEASVEFLADTGGPCVVKPARNTGAGDGVTCGLETPDEMRRACLHASRWRSPLLVEHSAVGHEYRLLFLDGELLDVVQRSRPVLTGDGRRTIWELVGAENQRRVEAGTTETARPLRVDLDLELTLRRAGRSLSSVLEFGIELPVKTGVSDNAAAENRTVHEISDEILEEAAAAVRVSRLRLAGVDVVTPDPTRSLAQGGGVILEVNSTPGLHHHFVVRDPSQATPIAAPILETLLAR